MTPVTVSKEPSIAQLRVRTLTADVIADMVARAGDVHWGDHSGRTPAKRKLHDALALALASDPVIQADPFLSASMIVPRHSDRYLRKLRGERTSEPPHDFRPHHFHPFPGDTPAVRSAPLSQIAQARKWDSIASTLVGLARGESITGADFSLVLVPGAGLAWTGSGGVHRLRAHLLWGADHWPSTGQPSYEVISTGIGGYDAAQDQANVTVERVFPRLLSAEAAFGSRMHHFDALNPEVQDVADRLGDEEMRDRANKLDAHAGWVVGHRTWSEVLTSLEALDRHLHGGWTWTGHRVPSAESRVFREVGFSRPLFGRRRSGR